MNVLALTILISVCLASIFIVCFIAELKRPSRRGLEHDALLPLEQDDVDNSEPATPLNISTPLSPSNQQ